MSKKNWLLLFKIAVGGVLLYVIYREVNQGHAILTAFRSANWINVFICALLLIPNFFFQYFKWRYLLRTRFPGVNNIVPLQSLLFGSALGFVTPGNLGELARGLFFKQYDRLVVTGLNVIDKLFGIIMFVTLGVLSLNVIMLTHFHWHPFVVFPLLIVSLLFLVFVWLVTLNPRWVRSFLYGINTMLPVRDKIKSFISCLDNFRRRDSLAMSALSFAWVLVIFFQYHVLVLAFTNVSVFDSFLAVNAVLITKIALPVSFADLGIREGAAVFYFTLFGVPRAAAFNAAILIFVINFLLPALVGSYYVFKLRWDLKANHSAVRQ